MRRRSNLDSIKQILVVIILVQLFWCPTWGLDPNKKVDQYLVKQWVMADGIPSNTISSIEQTPDGYLWIVTANDLVRFDGMKFSIIPFAGKVKIESRETVTPKTLFVDRAGTLWIGSTGGLTSYHYQTGRFKTFTSADGLTEDRIRHIRQDMQGNLWIGFWVSYLNRFTDGRFTVFNASNGLKGKKINAIVEDGKGNLLFGSRENGVFRYKDGKFFKYPIPGLENHLVITMHEDWKGDLWIGTDKGLFRVNDKRIEKYTARDGLSDNYIISILEDSERNLWIGTQKGLNRVNKKQNGAIVFERLLKTFVILTLFEDREKNLWVGTQNSGITRLKDGKFISYAPLDAHREEIFLSLFEDRQGDTWIGTFGGKLFRCRGSDIIQLIEPPELSGTGIAAIGEDAEGNLWLGTTGKGVFQKKKGTFTRFTTREGLADNTVTSICRDSRDNLWFSTSDGISVSRYPGGVFESFNSRDGLSGKMVHNVYEDKNGNIWIAADKGITVLKGGKIAKQNAGFYLKGVSVTCIYEDLPTPDEEGGVFWIATSGAGLKRLRLKDGAADANVTVTSYTTAEGMTTDYIYQFFEDRRGNFWLMSDSGILRVGKTELNRFAGGDAVEINCAPFGISDGMKSLEFNNALSKNSVLKTGNGELWFITTKGISIVNPEKIRINKSPPPVLIEAVFFDRRAISPNPDAGARPFKGITDFSFHFTAPTFLSPGKIKFKYRLEGFEKEWVFLPPAGERVARYKNLAPGTYTFRVTASNVEGVWNRTGDAITFTLKPFFYQTLVFKAAILFMFIILAAVAFYIYKKRPVKFKKKTTDRNKFSPPAPQFVDRCVKKLKYLMEVENLYRDADISLPSLAEKLSISPHLLSYILNEELKRNFSDFINSYRIEEAQKILQGPRGARKKMVVVADEVGFNTIAAFYNAFKKYTHMTPVRYQKKAQKKPPAGAT